MDQERTVKEVFESKLERSRRPRLRWLEDVEKNLHWMNVKRQWQKTVDGKEWTSVIKVAKALRGLYSQEASKYVIITSENMLNTQPLTQQNAEDMNSLRAVPLHSQWWWEEIIQITLKTWECLSLLDILSTGCHLLGVSLKSDLCRTPMRFSPMYL